jgi:hypothetical protein
VNQLIKSVLIISMALVLISMGALFWFIQSSAIDESIHDIDPLEAIIHDQMFHYDSDEAQDPNAILNQFKRTTPLPEQD